MIGCSFLTPVIKSRGKALLTAYQPCGKISVVKYIYTQHSGRVDERPYCPHHFYGDPTVAKLAKSYRLELLVPQEYPPVSMGAITDGQKCQEIRVKPRKTGAKSHKKQSGKRGRNTSGNATGKRGARGK